MEKKRFKIISRRKWNKISALQHLFTNQGETLKPHVYWRVLTVTSLQHTHRHTPMFPYIHLSLLLFSYFWMQNRICLFWWLHANTMPTAIFWETGPLREVVRVYNSILIWGNRFNIDDLSAIGNTLKSVPPLYINSFQNDPKLKTTTTTKQSAHFFSKMNLNYTCG